MSPTSPSAKRASILIVDDIPDNITMLAGVLRPDHDVRFATSGPKALEIVESATPPDLVLLDIMMPNMTGLEVCERLKANPARRNIPVIFVTALGEVEDEQRGLELGAIDYITKPISPSIVQARVKIHLELAAARAALAAQNAILERKVSERTADLVATNAELKASYLESIELAFGLMSEADDRLGNHCKRVATYVKGMAVELALPEEEAFDLHVAALLHDLGLVALKGAGLDVAMQLEHPSPTRDPIYHSHPVVHMAALLPSERFVRVAGLVAAHHESLDGSGFPHGLRGDDIPFGSRLLAVADRWDVYAQLVASSKAEAPTFDSFLATQGERIDPKAAAALRVVLERDDPFTTVLTTSAADLTPGMVLARTLRTESGATLLTAGTALRADHIRDLARRAADSQLTQPLHVYRDCVS
ncbi:MAG: response regulator [Deltaproteobacteria bacterium]|nr:response regulator [Deltaproteobacteria bacterium]